ncbi:hypothetical protein EG329_003419, partial [Mollisiaceae sp. DMI_Dod_QoI]
MSTSNVERPLHLLSLDGGGVRGLSSIIILQYLMENISKRRGRVVQPWEEFDMIGGTSTGGLGHPSKSRFQEVNVQRRLIAIMLGRLRMSLDECERAYLELSERIFTPKRSFSNYLLRSKDFLRADGKFDHKVLEGAVKSIIARNPGLDESTLLKDSDPQCKVFVCATRTGNTEPAIFRSYDTTKPKPLFKECKIWEACRATSAATTFFNPIMIGRHHQEFADGGVLYNNPIQLVEQEASVIWPDRMESAVVVSIGTGSAPGGVFRGNLLRIVEAMKRIVTETEKTHNDFFNAHKVMVDQNRLYRFNVFHGLAEVGLEEFKQREKIANTTDAYLDKGEVQRQAISCIERLCKQGSQGFGPSPVDDIGRERKGPKSDASNFPKARLEQDLSDCIRSLSFDGITSRQNNISLAYQDTCEWLFEAASFREWKDRTNLQFHNGVLWIKGHPGVGKSTLMKHTLRHCKKEFGDHNIVYYFFNARGFPLEKSPLGLVRSLMVQLLEQDAFLQKRFIPKFLIKKTRHGQFEWEIGELKEFLLLEFKERRSNPTLLLIDALDECNDFDVQEVVDFLEYLSESAIRSGSNLKICLSSRHYPNIDMMKKLELVVEKQPEHDQDICKYVRGKLRATDENLQREILEKARHIFIWVVLVVELLNKEFRKGRTKAMWEKLNEIPSDLDELFSKLLKKDSEDDKTTILVFQWVLFSVKPLKPTQLYYAVLAGTAPEDSGAYEQSTAEFETIERFITDASKGLVEIVSRKETRRDPGQYAVQFIHQSVVDFLTRNQRLVKLDPTLAPDAVGASHARLTSCCINYVKLRSSGAKSNKDEVKKAYPFLEYASMNLLKHAECAQAQGVSQISLLWRFEKNGDYEVLQSLHDVFTSGSSEFQGGQLFYALSISQCYCLMQAFLLEQKADVNAQGGYYGNALQAAAAAAAAATHEGSKDVVELLLKHGADVNAQGGYYGNALQAAAAAATHEGSKDVVELLLKHGADVNAQGGYYGNALQAAAAAATHEGSKDVVELLLKHGAD